jgi:hypothetical protein
MRKLIVVVLAAAGLVTSVRSAPASAAVGQVPKRVDTWAFCGVRPDDPLAQATADSMARDAGITATFGPCNEPTDYTVINPGSRYVSPADYMRVVLINAKAAMKTIVYDARIYGNDTTERNAAITFWTPVLANIAAWDVGDEYQPPPNPEWNVLKQRWNNVRTLVTPRTGVLPYVNHLTGTVAQALIDLPGSADLVSFTRYTGDLGASVAEAFDTKVKVVMCGINAFEHLIFEPTPTLIREGMADLVDAGCDRFLVFGGAQVYDSANFGESSLVDRQGLPTSWAAATLEGSGRSSFTPVGPLRLLETRPGLPTVDGIAAGVGVRPGGTTTALLVAGRAGVRKGARTAALNVTVTNAAAPGFVTVYPCDQPLPLAAQVTFLARTDVATGVVTKLAADGSVCLFSPVDTDLVVDLDGYYPDGASFTTLQPARLLETRTDLALSTVDGAFLAGGPRPAASVLELQVGGRGGVPSDATEAVLAVTVTRPVAGGYVSVYPCAGGQPTSSTVNHSAGATVTNTVVAALGADGKVCVFTLAPADLVIDVNGYVPARSAFVSVRPGRLMDTRTDAGIVTVDGQQVGLGLRAAQTSTALVVGGRASVGTTARAVVLNVTVTGATQQGFVTVYPCASPRPNASSLNYAAGATVANLVVAPLAADGRVCLFTSSPTHLIADVTSYLP